MAEWMPEALAPLTSTGDSADIDLALKGSFPGLTELQIGKGTIGVIAIPKGEDLPGDPFIVKPIAYKAVYVLVNQANQIRELSKKRLAGVFGANEETDYGEWGQLGLTPWVSRTIAASIHSGDNSLVDGIFKYTTLRSPETKGSVAGYLDADKLDQFVSTNETGIAIASFPPMEGSNARLLPIAKTAGSPGYLPNEETVHFGDYEMALPYYIVYPKSKSAAVQQIVTLLLSDRFAQILDENGFIPLPQQERMRLGITLGM